MKRKTSTEDCKSAGPWLEDFAEFERIVADCQRPVILGEGRRELEAGECDLIREFSQRLALRFPHIILRTGNAPGTDEAFAAGFGAVAPSRIEYILPVPGHRKSVRYTESRSVSISDVGRTAEEALATATVAATPANERVIGLRYKIPRLRAKANYLLRDTLKVLGSSDNNGAPALDRPVAALFRADTTDPMAGGTGHTIRVCLKNHIPTALQHHWMQWLM